VANEKEGQAETTVGILTLCHTDEKKTPQSQKRPYLVSHTHSLWLGQKIRIIVTIYKVGLHGKS